MARTVLIVDDHAPFRALARALLQLEGSEVGGEAADALSALDADQPVAASGNDAGHVAHGHLDVVAVRLLTHPVDHVLRQLDAVHAHACSHQRQGDTTGTHGELQRVSLTGELGEERDGLLLVASSVDRVVALGLLIAEARPGIETLHVIFPSDQACTGRWPAGTGHEYKAGAWLARAPTSAHNVPAGGDAKPGAKPQPGAAIGRWNRNRVGPAAIGWAG